MTLVELLIVMLILGTIVTSLTQLFVSGTRAELDANNRFQAQQQARVAVDRMRREIHCASAVSATASSVTASVPGYCPSAVGGSITSIVYDLQTVSGNRFRLRRAVNGGTAVTIADYVVSQNAPTLPAAFSYTAPSASSLGKLNVDFRVNINPNEGWKTWHLKSDIVLRNTLRQ